MSSINTNNSYQEIHHLINREFKSIRKSEKSFCVVQYNILADALSSSTPEDNFCKVPSSCLEWSFRSNQLLKQILSFHADIICLEEVDHFDDYFLPKLSSNGYQGSFSPKKDSPCLRFPNNNGPDGVSIFFKTEKYILKEMIKKYLFEEDGKEGRNPILVNVLEEVDSNSYLIIGVIHLKAKRAFENRRKAQSESAIDTLKNVAINYDNASIILCGDFNGEPGEPFYKTMVNAGFKSTYVDALGVEPEFTTWKIRPTSEEKHTIDYIWQHTVNSFSITGVLCLMSDDSIPAERFPSFGQPSDHIPLCIEFSRN